MAKISYQRTYFQTPDKISEQTYFQIKNALTKNREAEIFKGETFSQYFKWRLRGVAIGLIVFFLLITIADSVGRKTGDSIGFFAGLSFLVSLGCGLNLLLEGPSFATYVKKRDEYFNRMKYAIANTSNYTEFERMFYFYA